MQLTSQTSELEAALATLSGTGAGNSTAAIPADLSKLLVEAVGGKNDQALAAAAAAEEDDSGDKEQVDKMSEEQKLIE